MDKISSQGVGIHKCYCDLSQVIKKIVEDKWIPRIVSLVRIYKGANHYPNAPMNVKQVYMATKEVGESQSFISHLEEKALKLVQGFDNDKVGIIPTIKTESGDIKPS